MSWVCPHCNHSAVIRGDDKKTTEIDLNLGVDIWHCITVGIVCPHPDCGKPVITIEKTAYIDMHGTILPKGNKTVFPVYPQNINQRAKDYPSYIPSAILADYQDESPRII